MIATKPKPLASVVPIEYAKRKGGPAWRRKNGLQHWRELAAEYAAQRYIRPDALVPLPEDVLHPPRNTQRKGIIFRIGRGEP